jgi:hypothetical protein
MIALGMSPLAYKALCIGVRGGCHSRVVGLYVLCAVVCDSAYLCVFFSSWTSGSCGCVSRKSYSIA